MDDAAFEDEILRALYRRPGSRFDELARAVGVPRTNFGRQLTSQLRRPLNRLIAQGLIDEDAGRYSLTEKGRPIRSKRLSGTS